MGHCRCGFRAACEQDARCQDPSASRTPSHTVPRGSKLYRRHQRQCGVCIAGQQQRQRPRPNRLDADVRDGAAAARRRPIAMPNDTTTKANSLVACIVRLNNSTPWSSTADAGCIRTPARLMACPTIGSAQTRMKREGASPSTAPASTPRAISRAFAADPIRHTYIGPY
jgi:hypothetical protein